MNSENSKSFRYDLEDRLVDFASRVIDVVESLPSNSIAAKHLGNQLVRSGTSPALNYGEAQGAESRADFVHKMKIVLKELRETKVCIKIITKRNYFSLEKLAALGQENDELIAIIFKSIATSRDIKQ